MAQTYPTEGTVGLAGSTVWRLLVFARGEPDAIQVVNRASQITRSVLLPRSHPRPHTRPLADWRSEAELIEDPYIGEVACYRRPLGLPYTLS